MARININTGIDPAVGDDNLVLLLRELAAAADGGQITHLNQLTHLTLDCDAGKAAQIEALANEAGVGSRSSGSSSNENQPLAVSSHHNLPRRGPSTGETVLTSQRRLGRAAA